VPVNVKPVPVPRLAAVVADAPQKNWPVPKLITRVLLLLQDNAEQVTFLLFRFNVPLVNVRMRVVMVSASTNVQAPPTPLSVIAAKSVVPAVVMFCDVVELNVNKPLALQTVPVRNVKSPEIAIVPEEENVTVPAVTDRLRQASAPVSVTV
jgi:hypothetical protein